MQHSMDSCNMHSMLFEVLIFQWKLLPLELHKMK